MLSLLERLLVPGLTYVLNSNICTYLKMKIVLARKLIHEGLLISTGPVDRLPATNKCCVLLHTNIYDSNHNRGGPQLLSK